MPQEYLYIQQPAAGFVDNTSLITTQPIIQIRTLPNGGGNIVTTGPNSTLAITVSVIENGTLTNNTVSAVGGIATFTGLRLNVGGTWDTKRFIYSAAGAKSVDHPFDLNTIY